MLMMMMMESNEICMSVDVKLATHDKRPDFMRYKTWTRSAVKIEAVKCFPCFLRITIIPEEEQAETNQLQHDNDEHDVEQLAEGLEQKQKQQRSLNVPIIVPGVTVSLASSRTKQHSYGLFWKQNRRECFIYFAVDTEANLRRYVKWVKRAIRHLELYRQMLNDEQRRNSSNRFVAAKQLGMTSLASKDDQLQAHGTGDSGELACNDVANSSWSRRVSHISNIYEEICDASGGGAVTPPRLSRRLSRSSIASGIYEEMKCITSGNNNISFNGISEEPPIPPPLPPMPLTQQRKRFNTFENDNCNGGAVGGLLGDIPRSNTNPECEMAKKKKYKKVLENIFGSGRSKRTKSVSESSHTCSTEDVVNCQDTPKHGNGHAHAQTSSGGNSATTSAVTPIYVNDAVAIVARKRHRQQWQLANAIMADAKRNSFSSPDLSKINFLDTYAEEQFQQHGGMQLNDESLANSDDLLDLSSQSLDESSIPMMAVEGALPVAVNDNNAIATNTQASIMAADLIAQIRGAQHPRTTTQSSGGSLESLNISQQIPVNFNFSACNSSSINLLGAHAIIGSSNGNTTASIAVTNGVDNKPELKMDELNGYCFMAPIKKKMPPMTIASLPESTSSGYSTGSYCSSSSTTSSCTNSTDDHLLQRRPSAPAQITPPPPCAHNEHTESVIYESMHMTSTTSNDDDNDPAKKQQPPLPQKTMMTDAPIISMSEFTGNLYENLLTIKAAQELCEHMPSTALTTSTPTDSPHTEVQNVQQNVAHNSNGVLVEGSDDGIEHEAAARGEGEQEEESYYQTPRKSIISIDDKIPSYYPNSCETVKMRRSSQSHSQSSPSPSIAMTPPISDRSTVSATSSSSIGLQRQMVVGGIRTQRERKDISISPLSNVMEQRRHTSATSASSPISNGSVSGATSGSHKSNKKAHKLNEHIYTVTQPDEQQQQQQQQPQPVIGLKRKSLPKKDGKKETTGTGSQSSGTTATATFNKELKEKLHKELLTMAMLQNIDFKFDDTKALYRAESTESEKGHQASTTATLQHRPCNEGEEENYYARIVTNSSCSPSATITATYCGNGDVGARHHRFINMSPRHIITSPSPSTSSRSNSASYQQQPLKLNQQANQQQQTTPLSSTIGQLLATRFVASGDTSPCSILQKTKSDGLTTSTMTATGNEWMRSNTGGTGGGGAGVGGGMKKFASLPRFKKIDFSPLKMKINNVLQRNTQHTPQQQ